MLLSQDIEAKVQRLILQNRRLDAVKLVIDSTGCTLKEAKDFVDSIAAGAQEEVAELSAGELDARLNLLLAQGKKIDAVKLYKEATGLGLAESKDYVDSLQNEAALFDDRPTANKRDTAIDQIMEQQSQAKVLMRVQPGVSAGRIVLLFLIFIAVVGLLIYLFAG